MALHELAYRTARKGCDVQLEVTPGDVVVVVPYYRPLSLRGEVEVVFAVGGFDIWKRGEPFQVDVSSEVAIQALADEYRRLKKMRVNRAKAPR